MIYKVALYGDSLACPRHNIVDSHERYIALVENYMRKEFKPEYIEVRDRAKGGAVISELYDAYIEDNTYYKLPGDVLIIQVGIVDCAPRPIDEARRVFISKLPGLVKRSIIRYIHKRRASMIKASGGFVKTSPEKFYSILNNFVGDAIQNYLQIFVINICPTNKEIEKRSPGFGSNIDKYNGIIYNVVENLKTDKLTLIDVNQMIKDDFDNIDSFVVKQDGHHIYPKTHKWIAEAIIKKLSKIYDEKSTSYRS